MPLDLKIMKTKAGEAPLPFIYENFPKELLKSSEINNRKFWRFSDYIEGVACMYG